MKWAEIEKGVLNFIEGEMGEEEFADLIDRCPRRYLARVAGMAGTVAHELNKVVTNLQRFLYTPVSGGADLHPNYIVKTFPR
jgi:hypothetical protein